ncbi:MAG TPA: Ig-like domain repeat protein, partial [Acidobacteriaceae bacterium]|nr:Ig-like domain repeat protein [Acidobacteriaceae bacterium]
LLICDRGNHRVRRVSNGVVTTIAGNGVQGYSGDGALATTAELNQPSSVAVNAGGKVYIADSGNARIRVVTPDGKIATFAGTGAAGFSGDGGPGLKAAFSDPRGLAIDSTGGLLITDAGNRRVRRVGADGTIATIVGSGVQGSAADNSPGLSGALDEPAAAAVSGFGWPLIADAADRKLSAVLSDGRLYAPAGLASRTSQLSAAAPDAVYGSAQATVQVTSSPGAPLGVVQVLDSGDPVGQGSLSAGAVKLALPALSAGQHTLTVAYAGDGIHPAAMTTSRMTVSPAPVVAMASSATVSYGAPLPVLTGTLSGVLAQDAGRVSAVFSAQVPGIASVGTYPISASLAGVASGNYTLALSSGSGSLTVVPAATVATMLPAPTAYSGLPMQLSAQIAPTTAGMPTGSVSFLDGSAIVATATLVNGSATAVYLSPSAGQHAFSVNYSGDANFLPSTSVISSVGVAAMPDFAVSAAGNSQQTVLAGSAASYVLNVASTGGPFTGAVMLSAIGLPAGSSATFSPSAVVPGASSASVTMTISTASQTAQLRPKGRAWTALIAACLLLPIFRRRRVLAALACAMIMCSLSGCGARTISELTLPVKSYAVTVKATSTNLAGSVVTHTVNVTLGIQ